MLSGDSINGVVTATGDTFMAEAVILATGHSARDIFTLLHHKNILIEAKPFALGVRIEHPQSIIDSIQYHCDNRGEYLPPASYSLVQQVEEKGEFSFCMCPGGIIAPAASHAEEKPAPKSGFEGMQYADRTWNIRRFTPRSFPPGLYGRASLSCLWGHLQIRTRRLRSRPVCESLLLR